MQCFGVTCVRLNASFHQIFPFLKKRNRLKNNKRVVVENVLLVNE